MAGGDSDGDLQLFAAHQAAVIRHRRPVDSGTQEPMHYIYIFANYTSPDADILLDLINLPFPISAVHEAPQETIIKDTGEHIQFLVSAFLCEFHALPAVQPVT